MTDPRWEHAACGLLTIKEDGTVVDANAMFRRWCTLEPGGSLLDVLKTGDRIYWETHVRPLLAMQGGVSEIALRLGTHDGELPVLLNIRTRPGSDGLFDAAVFPAADRRSYETEILRARRRAEEAERHSRELASTLQASLLPPESPQIPGVVIAASYRPAADGLDIGGDFYDVFRLSEDAWLVAVGDVCGKGAEAATVTALVRFAIRGAAAEVETLRGGGSLRDIVRGVNRAVLLDRAGHTCTLLLAKVERTGGDVAVSVASAGHPLPYLLTEAGDVTRVGRHGTLLGAFTDGHQPEDRFDLMPGETLVMFTDGVTEARRSGEFFGDERLEKVLSEGYPPEELASTLTSRVVDFSESNTTDDLAVVVVHRPFSD